MVPSMQMGPTHAKREGTGIAGHLVLLLCAVLLVGAAGLSGGCGGKSTEDGTELQWTEVVTTKVSGAEPVKLNLGIYSLGKGVRLAWVLLGAEDPPVTLTFRVVQVAKGYSYGGAISSKTDPEFATDDAAAFRFVPIWPGKYRIYFGQRFPESRGPGYDAKLTVYTLK
jgi:hypothetical protein